MWHLAGAAGETTRQPSRLGRKEIQLAEQSSTGALFRALVMLTCLVAIPLVAVFGKSLPGMLQELLRGHWPAVGPSSRACLDEAPKFEPIRLPGSDPTPAADQPHLNQASDQRRPAAAWSGGPVLPATYEASSGPASCGLAGGSAADPHVAKAGDPVAAAPRATTDQYTQLQDRLWQLGAKYCLLESWGNQERLYRFYCKVAVGADANYTRCFEATDRSPLGAAAQVLQQVEGWRAGR
jgi:hypothetical protein